MENQKIDPKRVKRIDLDKMFQIHLQQFKSSKKELQDLGILINVQSAFYNGVVQALIAMDEMKEVFEHEQLNDLLSDLMVQAEKYFNEISTQPVNK